MLNGFAVPPWISAELSKFPHLNAFYTFLFIFPFLYHRLPSYLVGHILLMTPAGLFVLTTVKCKTVESVSCYTSLQKPLCNSQNSCFRLCVFTGQLQAFN